MCFFQLFFSFSFLKKIVLAEGGVGRVLTCLGGDPHHSPLLRCPQNQPSVWGCV